MEAEARSTSRMGYKCRSTVQPFTRDGFVYHASSQSPSTLRGVYHAHNDVCSAVLDTGASKSVVGLKAARRILRVAGRRMAPVSTPRRFRFGDHVLSSMGTCTIHIPTPGKPIELNVDIVHADVPLLIGLDVLDHHRLQPLTIENRLQHVPHTEDELGWSLPIARRTGHVWLDFKPMTVHDVRYTRQQLTKLHRHLYHPSAKKLYALLKRAKPEDLAPDTKKILDDISAACHRCQEYSRSPLRFKIRLPDDVFFNKELRMDLMFVESKPILHIIDVGTTFNAAVFLVKQDANSVWNAFVRGWSRLYLGDPERILTDQGSVFRSEQFVKLCAEHEIVLEHTGTESHNSLGVGERYHEPLRKTYLKLRADYPRVPEDVLLQCAVFTINCTAGPEGLVPSLLVFGALPKLPGVVATSSLSNKHRFRILANARAEYASHVARMRIAQGLASNVPGCVDEVYAKGDHVYVYRDTQKRWTGPHEVLEVDEKDIKLIVDSTGIKSFNVSQVKRAIEPSRIHWTEVLSNKDPRCHSPQMTEAKKKELRGLFQRGTFRVVIMPEGHGENVVPSRFVLAIKHEDGKEVFKARFVLGGHRDRDKRRMLHSATALSQTSMRLLLAVASIFGLDVWTTDVAQAYLQSASLLQRRIFTRPHVLELGPKEYLQLLLPLYGLAESGDYWFESLTRFTVDHCRFTQSACDLALFFRREGKKLVGMSGHYVDDLLRAAPSAYRQQMEDELSTRFETKESSNLPTDFLGTVIGGSMTTEYWVAMTKYIERMKVLPKNASYKEFASARASVLWLVNCRPDVAAYASLVSSVTAETFSALDVADLNSKILALKATKHLSLHFPKLDMQSLRLVCYVDASFANRHDKSSQIGYLICLTDKSRRAAVLSFKSCRSWRVAQSAMTAEALAFAAGFDAAHALRHQLAELFGKSIPLWMFTDSLTLFKTLTTCKRTTEGRLMIDIYAARESFRRREIDNIGFIRTAYNPADDLTKLHGNGALMQFLRSGILNHPIADCIVRN